MRGGSAREYFYQLPPVIRQYYTSRALSNHITEIQIPSQREVVIVLDDSTKDVWKFYSYGWRRAQ